MHSIIGLRELTYIDESRSRVRFLFGLMFSMTVEAVCSATKGVSDEAATEAVGDDDEQCKERRGFFALRDFEFFESGERNQSSITLLYVRSGEINLVIDISIS